MLSSPCNCCSLCGRRRVMMSYITDYGIWTYVKMKSKFALYEYVCVWVFPTLLFCSYWVSISVTGRTPTAEIRIRCQKGCGCRGHTDYWDQSQGDMYSGSKVTDKTLFVVSSCLLPVNNQPQNARDYSFHNHTLLMWTCFQIMLFQNDSVWLFH